MKNNIQILQQVEEKDDMDYFKLIQEKCSFTQQVEIMKKKYFTKKAHLIRFKSENSKLLKRILDLERTIMDLKEDKGILFI